jgi:hypothetical protein
MHLHNFFCVATIFRVITLKNIAMKLFFEYQLTAHFRYIKWIFNLSDSQGRHVRGTDGRTLKVHCSAWLEGSKMQRSL